MIFQFLMVFETIRAKRTKEFEFTNKLIVPNFNKILQYESSHENCFSHGSKIIGEFHLIFKKQIIDT